MAGVTLCSCVTVVPAVPRYPPNSLFAEMENHGLFFFFLPCGGGRSLSGRSPTFIPSISLSTLGSYNAKGGGCHKIIPMSSCQHQTHVAF